MATFEKRQYAFIKGIKESGLFYAVIALAILLAIWPLFYLLLKSFSAGFISIRPLTLQNWVDLFSVSVAVIIFNTFLFAIPASAFEVLLGTFFAWVIEQTDTPGKRFLRQSIVLPYLIPTAVAPLAWILLLDPDVGFINDLAKTLSIPVFNVYGYYGMVLITVLQGAPMAYLVTSGAIRNMDAAYIEASVISESSPLRIFWDQVVKMNRPAVLSAAVMVLAKNVGFVAIPLLIGVPAGFFVLSSAIVNVTSGGAVPNYGLASVYGIVMIIISFSFVFAYIKLTKGSERFTSQGGRNVNNLPTGRWKYGFLSFTLLYIFIAAVLPLTILIIQSFTLELNILRELTFSLDHYYDTLSLPRVRHGTINAILLGIGVGLTATFIGFVASWISEQTDIPYTDNFDEKLWIVLGVPSLAISLVMLLLLARTPLYGTALAFFIPLLYTPIRIGIRYTSPGVAQANSELFEAGLISGDTNVGVMGRLGMPITRGVILASIANSFIHVIRALSPVFFLVLPGATVIAFTVFQFTSTAQYNRASVLSLVLIALGSLGWFILNVIRARYDISRGA